MQNKIVGILFFSCVIGAVGVASEVQTPSSQSRIAKTQMVSEKSKRKVQIRQRKVQQSGMGTGFALWQENMKLLRTSGESYPMKSIFYGGKLNFRQNHYHIAKSSWGWRYELMGLFGQMNVSQDTPDISYFKRGAPFFGAGVSGSFFWMAPGKRTASLGLTLPLLYRYCKLQNPDSASTFESPHNVIAGLGLEMNWNLFGRFWLEQSLSWGYGLRDTLWLVSLQWDFL